MGKTSYSFGVLLGSLLAYIACGSDYAGVVDITGALLANFATPVSAQSINFEIPASPTAAASLTCLVLGDDVIFPNGSDLLRCRQRAAGP